MHTHYRAYIRDFRSGCSQQCTNVVGNGTRRSWPTFEDARRQKGQETGCHLLTVEWGHDLVDTLINWQWHDPQIPSTLFVDLLDYLSRMHTQHMKWPRFVTNIFIHHYVRTCTLLILLHTFSNISKTNFLRYWQMKSDTLSWGNTKFSLIHFIEVLGHQHLKIEKAVVDK